MAKHVYGIDLGSYEIKVYDLEKDSIWTEKNVVAADRDGKLIAVGDQAYEMYEKTPPNIRVIFPMKDGVISDFQHIQDLLQYLLSSGRTFVTGGEYIIAVPADVTELEKRAFYDLLVHSSAKARSVSVIERGVADAIGLGLYSLHSNTNPLERDTVVFPRFGYVRCIGCGRCEISCMDGGHQAIRLDENRRPRLNGKKCVGCHLCVLVCPQHAIHPVTKRVSREKQ